MTNSVDVRLLEHTLEVHNRNGVANITLPKSFCDQFDVNFGDHITIVVSDIRRGKVIQDLVTLYVK